MAIDTRTQCPPVLPSAVRFAELQTANVGTAAPTTEKLEGLVRVDRGALTNALGKIPDGAEVFTRVPVCGDTWSDYSLVPAPEKSAGGPPPWNDDQAQAEYWVLPAGADPGSPAVNDAVHQTGAALGLKASAQDGGDVLAWFQPEDKNYPVDSEGESSG